MPKITIPTDIRRSHIQGKNGLFGIKAIKMWTSGDESVAINKDGSKEDLSEGSFSVFIDGIGQRDYAINGGLRITAEAMDNLVESWKTLKEIRISSKIEKK